VFEAFAKLAEQTALEFVRVWVSPGARSYWGFMVPSLFAATWLFLRDEREGRDVPPAFRTFSAETWFSRSARNDYGIVALNSILLGGLFAPLAAWLAACESGNWMSSALGSTLGTLGAEPTWWAPVALALSLFVIDDMVRYFLHLAEHRVPFLWELHKVHHSAEVLNFITAERHHPLSHVWYRVLTVLTSGVVNGVFLWAFGSKLAPWTLVGANGFWIASNMLFGTLRHSPAWLSFGPRVERWIISPAQHQVHHSADPAHFDRNFGGTLAVWDRMFGTLHVTGPRREVTAFGLGDETPRYRDFVGLFTQPMLRALGRRSESSLPSA
jgi:sterol desaturase/sphingolipid hydroxylase (fatty acid hydroxylase superfamily)